jgi:hypothetical protein
MILRYCPPLIFAHRCYLEGGENQLKRTVIEERFGKWSAQSECRWTEGQTGKLELNKMGITKRCSGVYYAFRTRDDQVLFYMTFQGALKGR